MKKFLLYFLGIVAMSMISPTFVHADESIQPTYSGGDGTSNNPYLISTYEDLMALTHTPEHWVDGTFFKQTADIILPSALERAESMVYNLQPIGVGGIFSADYYGEGFSISGLTIQAPWEIGSDGERTLPESPYATLDGLGSFGLFTNTQEATIDGVVLEDVKILLDLNDNSDVCIGGLIGKDVGNTVIRDCAVEGIVSGYDCVGGLIGNSNVVGGSSVEASIVKLKSLAGLNNVGGIVGIAKDMILSYCVVEGAFGPYASISGENNIGGLIGQASNPTISTSYSLNKLDLENVGHDPSDPQFIGSFIGLTQGGVITNCFASTSENGLADTFHHFLGKSTNTTLNSCFENTMGTSEISEKGGIITMPNEQMKDPSQFVYNGWDFKDNWRIGVYGYPTLSVHKGVRLPDGDILPYLWKGREGTLDGKTSWNTAEAWVGGSVPHVESHGQDGAKVYIPQRSLSASNCVVNTEDAECYSLLVAKDGALSIEYDVTPTQTTSGQLYVAASSLGEVDYKLHIPGSNTDWHYISSPVIGQSIASFLSDTDNNIPRDVYYRYMFGMLDQANAEPLKISYPAIESELPDNYEWKDYLTYVTDEVFEPGISYWITHEEGNFVTFSGNINTEPVTVNCYAGENEVEGRWAFLGNPYTAALDIENLYSQIFNKLSPSYQAIYTYDYITDQIVAHNFAQNSNLDLSPCQGFFVRVQKGGCSLTFTPDLIADPSDRRGVTFKSTQTENNFVKLESNSTSGKSSCWLYFIEGNSNGVDPGWDAEVLPSSLGGETMIATKLLDSDTFNDSRNYQVQTLGADQLYSCSVDVSIHTKDASNVTISVADFKLPDDISIFLYDRELDVETEISNNKQYTFVSGQNDLDDRFTLCLKSVTENEITENKDVSIVPQPNNNTIMVNGIDEEKARITLYSSTGQVVMSSQMKGYQSEHISVGANLANGIYIVKIRTKENTFTQKIKW